jgi:hypothetical protein
MREVATGSERASVWLFAATAQSAACTGGLRVLDHSTSGEGVPMTGIRPLSVVAGAIATTVLVTSCTGGGGKPVRTSEPLPTSSSSSSSPSSTSSDSTSRPTSASTAPDSPSEPGIPSDVPADARPGVQAYLAYQRWVVAAAMHPKAPNTHALGGLATGAAYSAALNNLNSTLVWRGSPDEPRVRAVSMQAGGTVVNLHDCAKPGTLRPYYVATGKAVPLQSNPVAPPYLTTAQVVRLHGRWLVSRATTDRSATCRP